MGHPSGLYSTARRAIAVESAALAAEGRAAPGPREEFVFYVLICDAGGELVAAVAGALQLQYQSTAATFATFISITYLFYG